MTNIYHLYCKIWSIKLWVKNKWLYPMKEGMKETVEDERNCNVSL